MTKKPVPSGWCITGHHKQCPYTFAERTCPCECHTDKEKE